MKYTKHIYAYNKPDRIFRRGVIMLYCYTMATRRCTSKIFDISDKFFYSSV